MWFRIRNPSFCFDLLNTWMESFNNIALKRLRPSSLNQTLWANRTTDYHGPLNAIYRNMFKLSCCTQIPFTKLDHVDIFCTFLIKYNIVVFLLQCCLILHFIRWAFVKNIRFYAKQFTLHSVYTSVLAFPGNWTYNLVIVSTILHWLSYRNWVFGYLFLW